MKKLAVIDLGTNTFHLLIVEMNEAGRFVELYRKSIFVKLAEEGIHQIGSAPFTRGLEAMKTFQKTIEEYTPDQLKAFGTAALRTASNGTDFIQKVKEVTGIDIQLIPGNEEARLIHRGVVQAIPLQQEKNLIIDIGGGSVEFILSDNTQVFWAQSFPIGVAVLYKEWQKTDPISKENIEALDAFFTQQLTSLFAVIAQHRPSNLIGASGAFDVLQSFIRPKEKESIYSKFPVANFHPFFQRVITKSLPERFAMEGLPKDKAEMIVVALLLINFVIQKANIKTIFVSAYALKEGILSEMIP